MLHPDAVVLADLAVGESVDQQAADHVAGCSRCAAELGELHRTMVLTRETAGADVDWEQPPAALWSRIEASIDTTGDDGNAEPPEADAQAPIPLARTRSRRRPSRSLTWLVGVAAAGAIAGLLAGRALWAGPTQLDPPVAVSETGLQTLDTAQVVGAASVVRENGHLDLSLDLKTQSLSPPGNGYLEVWLINRDGRRMVAVGVLDAPQGQSGQTTLAMFPISQSLLDAGYVVVDVSREAFDDDPTHSGDSLARGTLA